MHLLTQRLLVVGSPAKTAPAASRKQMVEAIRRCIRQSSTQRFNNPDDGFSKDGVELTFPVGAWDVCSTLGFGGRGKCIFYWNHIASKERSIPHGVPYRWLYHSESICSMLGISGMTKWDVVPKSCLDEWAQTVVDLWELFYGFADTLGLAEIA